MRGGMRAVASRAVLLCCVACGAPPDDSIAELELSLDSTACTLGAECERWGAFLDDGADAVAECLASAEPFAPVVWSQALAQPACPFGQCTLLDQQLTLDDDGSLVTLGAVRLPSQSLRTREGGLWITRHSPSGAPLSSALLDFSVPPPGIGIERHGTLVREATGRALLVQARAVMPFDAPRPLEASRISRAARPTGPAVFSTARSWGVFAALGPSGDWAVASHRRTAAGGVQSSLAWYGHRARPRWSRTWPEGSFIDAIHVTRDREVLVLAQDAATETRILYKLDERGVVAWRRAVTAQFDDAQLAASDDGAIYVATLRSTDVGNEVLFQKLAPDGSRVSTWRIPDALTYAMLVRAESGEVVVGLPGMDSDWLPTLDWYTFEAGTCQRTSYAWPDPFSPPPGRVAVYEDRHGARFFAAFQSIGQLRERREP